MPGPPPPPGPPPMAPPPPSFSQASRPPDNRGALLQSIQKGTKLKKTVTNDKSGPAIGGKVVGNNSSSSSTNSYRNNTSSNTANNTPSNGVTGLGGLFANGMPKLRSTGKIANPSNSTNSYTSSNNSSDNVRTKPEFPNSPLPRNMSNIQNELKKQLASDNKNRGPPPPAPVRNIPDESSYDFNQSLAQRRNPNGVVPASSVFVSDRTLQANTSTLHRKSSITPSVSENSTDGPTNGYNSSSNSVSRNNVQVNKIVVNHGKPNLAPKPPVSNADKPMPPPMKLLINGKVSRAHSMRSPRTPSTLSPESASDNSIIKFGTVRNMSSMLNHSLGNLNAAGSPKPRPNVRPTAPPPSVPQNFVSPQSKFSANVVKPPNHAPPPPPGGGLPQPPSHAPPPPPHKTSTLKSITTMNYASNQTPPPPPPPRNSSMTMTATMRRTLEQEFKFHPSSMFPKPPPFRNVLKVYSNKQETDC